MKKHRCSTVKKNTENNKARQVVFVSFDNEEFSPISFVLFDKIKPSDLVVFQPILVKGHKRIRKISQPNARTSHTNKEEEDVFI